MKVLTRRNFILATGVAALGLATYIIAFPKNGNNIEDNEKQNEDNNNIVKDPYNTIMTYIRKTEQGLKKLKEDAPTHWDEKEFVDNLTEYASMYGALADFVLKGEELEGVTFDDIEYDFEQNEIRAHLVQINATYYDIFYVFSNTPRPEASELSMENEVIGDYIETLVFGLITMERNIWDEIDDQFKKDFDLYNEQLGKLIDFSLGEVEIEGISFDDLSENDKQYVVSETYQIDRLIYQIENSKIGMPGVYGASYEPSPVKVKTLSA